MLYLLAANSLKCSISCYMWISPEAGGKRSAGVAVKEKYGETFESVAVCHRPPQSVLKLLTTTGDTSASLQLIGWQRWGQQVGQMVVPHCGQFMVLRERGGVHRHTLYMPFLHKKLLMSSCFTFLCSEIRKRISNSRWLLAAAASRDGAQRGGTGGKEVVEPGAQTDFRASSLIAFHRDGFWTERMAFIIYSTDFLTIYIHKTSTWKSKTQRSTASDGWQLAKKVWWLKTQPTVL